MAKQRAITDEEIIKALLESKTMQAAADACGLSVRTLYERTKEPAFIAEYSRVRADILRSTLADLSKHTEQATATIVQIMENPEEKASTRLQAAQAILDNVARFTKHLHTAEDAATIELARQKNRHDDEIFDLFPM